MKRRNQSQGGMANEVEYLGSDCGTDTLTERPIVVVTLRLDPNDSFVPSNLVLSVSQAERLRDDLSRILSPS